MKLFEVTAPQFTPEQRRYLSTLRILNRTTLSPSGKYIVNGNLTVSGNVTIKFPFESVSGDFRYTYTTDMTPISLVNAPQSVGGDFTCTFTSITSLKHAPQSVGGNFNCYNTKIASLEHAPQSVGGNFSCYNTKIASLRGIHKTHRHWKIGGTLILPHTCIDIVGLALIEGISEVQIHNIVFDTSDHDPHTFQEKLIDAGLKAHARM